MQHTNAVARSIQFGAMSDLVSPAGSSIGPGVSGIGVSGIGLTRDFSNASSTHSRITDAMNGSSVGLGQLDGADVSGGLMSEVVAFRQPSLHLQFAHALRPVPLGSAEWV